METLKCLIADDEPIARQILENYIKDAPNLELSISCKNAFEVLEFLENEKVDLLLLDINMPKFSGLSLIKSLQQKPAIIITTAYPEYAVEGFELSVTDYLLKPFSFERFLQAVLKVKKEETQTTEVVLNTTEEENTSIFIKSDKKLIKLNFEDINYIEACGNYIKIYTNEMILTPQTLSDFLIKLPKYFVRTHKSYIINFNNLKLIDGNQITLQNNTKLPIGKLYKKNILDKI